MIKNTEFLLKYTLKRNDKNENNNDKFLNFK